MSVMSRVARKAEEEAPNTPDICGNGAAKMP